MKHEKADQVAIHAGVQARGGEAGEGWAGHCGDDPGVGDGQNHLERGSRGEREWAALSGFATERQTNQAREGASATRPCGLT
jgi:hypothetical protein